MRAHMILSVTGQKGGVGKTTLAACIGVEWHRRGRRVLLADADPQRTLATWADVASEQNQDIPAVVSVGQSLRQQLSKMAGDYDHVVLDCPPRMLPIIRAALRISDLALIPVSGGGPETWALGEMLGLVREETDARPDFDARLIITRRTHTALDGEARDVLKDVGLRLMRTEVGWRVAYREALTAGTGVTVYSPKSKASDEIRRLVREIERS